MIKKSIFILLVVPLAFTAACYRDNVQEVRVSVPNLAGKTCYDAILVQLRRLKVTEKDTSRILSHEPDYVNREVIVKYNAMHLSTKNIEYAIAEAGFDANEVKAFKPPPPGCE